jgi:hypothetical protein
MHSRKSKKDNNNHNCSRKSEKMVMSRGRLLFIVANALIFFFVAKQFKQHPQFKHYPKVQFSYVTEASGVATPASHNNHSAISRVAKNSTNTSTSTSTNVSSNVPVTTKRRPSGGKRQIVISMSLCVTPGSAANVSQGHIQQRAMKLFHLAAVYATQLWKQQKSDLKVITLLAHTGETENEEALRVTTKRIEAAGGLVWKYDVSDFGELKDAACIKAAQLGRAFLHESDLVADEEVVVTSDVDAYPLKAKKLVSALRETNRKGDYYRAWVHNTQRAMWNNHTWPMCFIGMSSKDWKETMATTFESALHEQVHGNQAYSFYGDQFLVTAMILNRGLCTLPRSHGAWWKNKYIVRPLPPPIDDSLTCFKSPDGHKVLGKWGGGRSKIKQQYQWMHFLPTSTAQDLEEAYNTIAAEYADPVDAIRLMRV